MPLTRSSFIAPTTQATSTQLSQPGKPERTRHKALTAALALGWGLAAPSTVAARSPDQCEQPSEPEPPPSESEFQKVTLNGAPGEPIGMAVLPDGRVLHTTRGGRVWLHDPTTGFNTSAADIPVYSHDEEGLQGIAIDPEFSSNHWVYIYYSPPLDTPVDSPDTPLVNEGDAPPTGSPEQFAAFAGHMQLSRFRLEGNTLNLSTEQPILQVPVDRGICCHVGGDIDFDRFGNLYLSTGDDTNPFESDGYAPIDTRANRHPAFDAARTSGNTNDLRGKLLRIRVLADGSYRIPHGNLFPRNQQKTRSEIYAMGLRNPFRFSVDRHSGRVFLADYSPDATEPNVERGPAGQGKWMVIDRPGNYGWPFCATAELPYRRFDFETLEAGEPFDCARPINDSPNNTGRRRLPQVTQPQLWYSAAPSEQFPELGEEGVGPMGGPAYRFDRHNPSDRKWPRYFDGKPLFYEWTRDAIFEFSLTPARRRNQSPQLDGIVELLPSTLFENPMDLEFGADGALYVLEYGQGFFGENAEAQLSRIDHIQGNRTPVAIASSDRAFGTVPLSVQLSSAGSEDPDGDPLNFSWDFDADGIPDSTEPNPTATYQTPGRHAPTLRVTDSTGRASTAAVRIVAGNEPPVVTFETPVSGQPFAFGDTLSYSVTVTDNTPVDCSRVEVQYILGHDAHGHPLSTAVGCTGQFDTTLSADHIGAENVQAVLVASYTDAPTTPGVPALTGQSFVLVPPTALPASPEPVPSTP